jgi:hypothetical protein
MQIKINSNVSLLIFIYNQAIKFSEFFNSLIAFSYLYIIFKDHKVILFSIEFIPK